MAIINDFRSLLVSDTSGWHDGDGVITYSFLGPDMPRYYPRVNTDGVPGRDAWDVGGANVPFTNDFSMTVAQRAMTSLAIASWNELANVNLQPATIERGGADITGNGTPKAAGGTALLTNDDGSALVDISAVFEESINFFGTHYDASTEVFINTNGNITFGLSLIQYTPSGISNHLLSMIAPLWADVDTRAGSPILVGVDASRDVVTITWDNVGYYAQHASPSNFFQLQLFDRGGGDFDISWSADTASDGDPATGLGGTPARAGVLADNGSDFFEVPPSGNEAAITNLENITGNTGVTGLWVFEVRKGPIVGDIAFGSTEFDSADLFGFVSGFPKPGNLGNQPSRHGDMWINRSNEDQFVPGVGPVYGHTSWNTYLHEMGHALGLRHPNERPNNGTTNGQFTVMSYVPHPEELGESIQNQAFSLTPMVWDIQAIQELYGANTSTRTGDNVYFGDGDPSTTATTGTELTYQYATNSANNLGMQVLGKDGNYRNVILTIWDAGGTDLIDASDLSTNSHIDLRPGRYSSIGEIDNNIAMAAAVRDGGHVINFIENAWGGSGNDRLTGNNTHNQLIGNGGNDRLEGGRGNDTLEGGAGRDRLFGHRGHDELDGGAHRDRLFGSRGNDQLNGGGGNDRLMGGGWPGCPGWWSGP
ncbi:MAG: hypothetical protein COB16_11595 [Rhodobacteraceae bacterium]|nr:MAG: hypothetical protein COB16_11595 [Paracoccaceae bacterium]